MHFIPLLGQSLKGDEILEVLECFDLTVVYDFDRSHENIPDAYWASAKDAGFLLRFNEEQILDVIFLYLAPTEEYVPVVLEDDEITLFSSPAEAERHAAELVLSVTKGSAEFLGIQRDWVRIEYDGFSIHYEFRGGELALVTLSKSK